MNRKFGIEMEIVGIDRQTALRALRAISISVQNEDYNHNTRGHWKLVSDSSVHGGFEVVSPVLHGEAGLEEARAVATALDDAGATANRSCGLHVHFDARDLTAGDIHTIVRRYARHEAKLTHSCRKAAGAAPTHTAVRYQIFSMPASKAPEPSKKWSAHSLAAISR